jgi:hypothetical protein
MRLRVRSEITESACACVSTRKQWNRHALALRNKGIGMRLRNHSKTMESACACAQKQRNRHALAYPLGNKGIVMRLRTRSEIKKSGMRLRVHSETKESGMRLRVRSGNKENESDGRREGAGAVKVVFRWHWRNGGKGGKPTTDNRHDEPNPLDYSVVN